MTATSSPSRSGTSLGTRISLATLLLIALSVGTAVAITSLLIRKVAHDSARDSLKSSASVQETFQAQRYDRLQLASRIFLSNPNLTAYVNTAAESHDTKSLLDLLDQGKEDLGFDFAILLDPSGVVVARTDKNSAGQNLAQRPLVAKALTDFQASGVWREDDRLYYAVAAPVQAQLTVYGYLVTGFAITQVQAQEVNEISGADVAFLTDVGEKSGNAPKLVTTTLPTALGRSLAAAVAANPRLVEQMRKRSGTPKEVELTLDGEPWLALATPLLDAAGQPEGATVALVSLAREMAAYREIETALLVAGLISALLGGAAAFLIARRTLAPVRRLVTATEAARQGEYDQKIGSDRNDEVGKLARAFDVLLGDLREKRDMEAYVTELSRNLPEPQQGRAVLGGPQSRDVLLMGIELRRYAHAAGESTPQVILEHLALDLKQVTGAIQAQRGQIEGIAGHRVLTRFEGEGRGRRALSAAARVLGAGPENDQGAEEAPAIGLVAGKAVTGPVAYGDHLDRALVGPPVQQLDSLLREATSGEMLLSREVHDELRDAFAQVGYHLAERRGVLSPQPLYLVSARIAAHVTGLRGLGMATEPGRGESVTPAGASGVPTLSGIAPGALMGHRFEILSVLGAGGMGVVYKARDRELDDLVALKMLKRELWGDQNQLERLKSELKLARRITHPNVLRTHDFGEVDGIPYISMEYVRGVTLRYLLDQSGRLPYSAGLRLAKQLCAGLGAAHAVGVMHRDIKPENLILEPTGNAKLMDFGIARPVRRMEAGQTEAGMIVGTPLYLSPEQLQGGEIDTRADIYSTGVVLYEMFTGVLPFDAPTAVEIMIKHLREPPPPPHLHWPEIPPRLDAMILRCLAKDPDARYRSVEELARDLEGLSA